MRIYGDADIARIRRTALEIADELSRLAEWTPEKWSEIEAAIAREPWFSVLDTMHYFGECLEGEYARRGDPPIEGIDC